jgi:hypothetical protein
MKINFRKITAIFFCIVLILTMFTACGDKDKKGKGGKNDAGTAPVVDSEFIERYCGDWNGCVKFVDCTGKYEDWNGDIVAAICRINVDKDGNLTPFIGLNVEDTPFVDLKAAPTADKKITLTGKWADADIGEVCLYESGGTLSCDVKVEKEKGNLGLSFNFRRLDDDGWTDEDPCFSQSQIEYCKGKTFDELAEMIGYSKSDYPEASVAPAADTTKADDSGKKSSGGSIVGDWTYVFGDYVYSFGKDGKGTYTAGSTVMNFTYKDNGDSVEILYDGNTIASTYKYRIDGDKLFIEDSFGEETEYKK